MAAAIVSTAGNFARKNWKVITIIIFAAIIIFLLWKYWDRIKGFFRRTYGHFGNELLETRKVQLEELAQQAYQAIYDPLTFSEAKHNILAALGALNDDELFYTAKYYKSIAAGNSLYQDVGDEILFETDLDEKLQARLSALGLV